jgi:hypothetical protein
MDLKIAKHGKLRDRQVLLCIVPPQQVRVKGNEVTCRHLRRETSGCRMTFYNFKTFQSYTAGTNTKWKLLI